VQVLTVLGIFYIIVQPGLWSRRLRARCVLKFTLAINKSYSVRPGPDQQ